MTSWHGDALLWRHMKHICIEGSRWIDQIKHTKTPLFHFSKGVKLSFLWYDCSWDPLYKQRWWRHQMETFSALLALCARNSPVPVNSPHKGQWRGALMFSLICARINDWVNNREAGDLRRRRGHCDVNVMRLTNIRTWIGNDMHSFTVLYLIARPQSIFDELTHWHLGNLNEILDIWFSKRF